jgi:hypothetical protein
VKGVQAVKVEEVKEEAPKLPKEALELKKAEIVDRFGEIPLPRFKGPANGRRQAQIQREDL